MFLSVDLVLLFIACAYYYNNYSSFYFELLVLNGGLKSSELTTSWPLIGLGFVIGLQI